MKLFNLLASISSTIVLMSCTENSSKAQSSTGERVGGPCEGCEAIYENHQPFNMLNSELVLPGFGSDGNDLVISGIVYHPDKKTPAAGVILYFYHTDTKGVYPRKGNEKGWANRHGYLRGWLKTDKDGRYVLKTSRPASYPGSTEPAHIHCIVKEEGLNEYYIGDFLFSDDPFVKQKGLLDDTRNVPGGSGILQVKRKDGVGYATRDIVLGLNIDNYPKERHAKNPGIQSLMLPLSNTNYLFSNNFAPLESVRGFTCTK